MENKNIIITTDIQQLRATMYRYLQLKCQIHVTPNKNAESDYYDFVLNTVRAYGLTSGEIKDTLLGISNDFTNYFLNSNGF